MNQTAGKGNRSTGRKVEIYAFIAIRFNYTAQYDFPSMSSILNSHRYNPTTAVKRDPVPTTPTVNDM
jgi:hypothetical protein